MVVIASVSQTSTDESRRSRGTVYLLLFQKAIHMLPPAHALRAIEDINMQGISKGFPRASCGLHRRPCSGPPSGEREHSHGQRLEIWPFPDKFWLCHAVGLRERCITSSVALNGGGYLGVPCLLGRPWRLGLKRSFVELCGGGGFLLSDKCCAFSCDCP